MTDRKKINEQTSLLEDPLLEEKIKILVLALAKLMFHRDLIVECGGNSKEYEDIITTLKSSLPDWAGDMSDVDLYRTELMKENTRPWDATKIPSLYQMPKSEQEKSLAQSATMEQYKDLRSKHEALIKGIFNDPDIKVLSKGRNKNWVRGLMKKLLAGAAILLAVPTLGLSAYAGYKLSLFNTRSSRMVSSMRNKKLTLKSPPKPGQAKTN